MQSLKPGWKIVKFGDIAQNVAVRVDPADAKTDVYVGLEHLDPSTIHLRQWGHPSDVTGQKLAFKKGDVIFGRRRAYQRKLAVAEFDGICSAHAMVVRAKPKMILPEFLPFFLQSDMFMERAIEISVGSLSPTINWKALQVQEFPLPLLDEQKRIAEILWAADEAKESYRKVLVDCRTIELKLSASILFPRGIGIRFSGRKEQVPTGWFDTTVGEISNIIDPNPSHRYPPRRKEGVPLLATSDFVGEHGFSFDNCQMVPDETYEQQNARCQFRADDIVFARKGVLGHARLYGQGKKCFSHTITIIKAKPELVSPGYLYHIFRAPHFVKHLEVCMNSNSGVPTLGLQTIRDIRIAIPSLKMQDDFAAKLDTLLFQRILTEKHFNNLSLVARQCINDIDALIDDQQGERR